MVEVIGCLIRELATSSDLSSTAESDSSSHISKQLDGLYDLLLERTMDISSYVRTKDLSVLSKLCDLPVKLPKKRLGVTRVAIESLEDKASSVRKAAVMCLVKLILTHPYGMIHGGLLGLKDWEERYKDVCEELEKVEGAVGKAVERDGEEEDGSQAGERGEETEVEGFVYPVSFRVPAIDCYSDF